MEGAILGDVPDHCNSGVTIGRAALLGAQNLPNAVFKKFFWGRGGPFGILARGPTATLLCHCIVKYNEGLCSAVVWM